MTKQEAISVLESISAKTDYFLINDDVRAEAIDMAISALQEGDLQSTCSQLTTDTISRQAAIDAVSRGCKEFRGIFADCEKNLNELPPAPSEYEPVKAEDFAKTMSENTLYGYMAWHCEALELMKMQGFVICKKAL